MCASDIITDPDCIPTASDAALVETYNAMMEYEDHVESFPSRAVAEVRCAHALMVATERCAHAGVPKGVKPWPVAYNSQRKPPPPPPFIPEPIMTKLAPSAQALLDTATAIKERMPAPRERKATNPAKFNTVQATFAGTSSVQTGSVRAAVLKAIQAAPKSTISVAALDASFGFPTRGYLQKLMEKNHVTGLTV